MSERCFTAHRYTDKREKIAVLHPALSLASDTHYNSCTFMPDQKAIARRGFLDWGFQWRRAAKTKGWVSEEVWGRKRQSSLGLCGKGVKSWQKYSKLKIIRLILVKQKGF